ncbi:MAG: PAS domain-containing protein, partial [Bacteroidota bacterium]
MKTIELQEEVTRLQNELKAAERKYYDLVEKTNIELKELFDNSYDLIQIFRPNGEFRFVNKICKNKLGYTDKDLYDIKFSDFINEAHWQSTYEKLLRLEIGENSIKLFYLFT